MDRGSFQGTVKKYRRLMTGVAESTGWTSADWLSEVWLDGSCQCLELAEKYSPPGSRVLDYGCGVGFMAYLLDWMGYDVTGIDIDAGSNPGDAEASFYAPWGTCQLERLNPGFIRECWGKAAPGGIAFRIFNGREIPFPDSSFDMVMAHAVMEHIKPEILDQVIGEMKRVLTGGGILLILRTPRKGSYLEWLFRLSFLKKYAHQILYNEPELIDLLAREGFILREKEITDMFPAFPPRGMRIYNALSPLFRLLDRLLLRTPLRRYGHHMALVLEKPAGEQVRATAGG
jgi:SAM-dependent methyltransferase